MSTIVDYSGAVLLVPLALAAEPTLSAPKERFDGLEQAVRAQPSPNGLLALGEAWSREAEARELAVTEQAIVRADACFDAAAEVPPDQPVPGCAAEDLAVDRAGVDAAHKRAATRYRQFLRLYRDDPRADQAAFGLAFAWNALGEDARADAALTWLVGAYPDSVYAEDAWILLGERAFEEWDHSWALFAYAHAAAEDGRLQRWALYKSGWTLYRLGEYAAAIERMKEVVQGEPGTPLGDAALRDLVRFFADAGELDGVSPPRGRVAPLLERLAEIYEEQGKDEQAIQLWRRLVAEDPDAAKVPEYRGRILELFVRRGRPLDTFSELDRVLRLPEVDQAAMGASLEKAVRATGFELHRTGRHPEALWLYEQWLARWPDDPHAADIRWARAKALVALGQRDVARAAFQALVDADPAGRYARAAATEAERLRP